MTAKPHFRAIILQTLQNARYDGASTHDLADAVYGEDRPPAALCSLRSQIRRYNSQATGPRIIRHAEGHRNMSLYYLEGYEPQQAEPRPSPPPAFTINRIASRFAPGCQPRFGR